jgi:YHS domain-containing protein
MRTDAFLVAAALSLSGCSSLDSGARYNRSTHLCCTDHGTYGRDPVSGDPVWVTSAITRTYRGETYYFQSEDHAREFVAAPERFAYDDREAERRRER